MNSSVLFLIVIGLISDTCHSDAGTCSGVDISAEDDFNYADMVDKIWYVHILLDDTGKFNRDAKLIYKFDGTRKNVFGYYLGRSVKTSQCETVLYHIVEDGNSRPCKTGKQAYPASDEPELTFIATFIDRTKKRVLFYACYDVDGNNSTCNTAAAFGLTTRKNLQEGEKRAFEAKINAFGRPLPTEGLAENDIDEPAENDCEDPIAEVLGIEKKENGDWL